MTLPAAAPDAAAGNDKARARVKRGRAWQAAGGAGLSP